MTKPPRNDGYVPVDIKKRGSRKKTFSAKFELGPKEYVFVEAEIHCSYCHRNELIDVSSTFAGKFPHGFDGIMAKAKSYGWLVGCSKNIEQRIISGHSLAMMCPECRYPFEAQAKKLGKEMEFYGDDVYAICNPNA